MWWIWNQLTKREIIIDGGSTTRVGNRQTSKENGKPLPVGRCKGYIYPNLTKTYCLLTILIMDTINRKDTLKPVSKILAYNSLGLKDSRVPL